MAVVFIPGIKGSELVDHYPLNQPRRWAAERALADATARSPFDLSLTDGRHEARDGHWMRPGRVLTELYGPMIGKLRSWLAPEPVYTFGYDWRQRLERSARALIHFLDEVCAREREAERAPTLHFVTHSMGGLLLRSALGLRNRREPLADIGRIVFIAPPFRGSLGVPFALVVGETDPWFGTDPDHRQITRGFPATYQMLPSWPGCTHAEDGQPLDLFDPANWQGNVAQAPTFQHDFVRNAEAFVRGRRARHGGHSDAPMIPERKLAQAADRVLVICGADRPTPIALPVQTRNRANPNWFDFAHLALDPAGDGRVPLISAAIPGVPLAAFAHSGEHGQLCRDTRVTNLTSLWLQGGKALRLAPREPDDPIRRRQRVFPPWDGHAESLGTHIA